MTHAVRGACIRRRKTESHWHWRARQQFGDGEYRLGQTYCERDGSAFTEVWEADRNVRVGHMDRTLRNFGDETNDA